MSKKYTFEDCARLLCEKQAELDSAEANRYPRRADFTDEQVTAIKAFLGPWPRALEKAGLKPADESREAAKIAKRIELKRKKTQAKIAKQ